ncbi:MAG: DUF4419 domain-containing protein [Myxococcota bacterium]
MSITFKADDVVPAATPVPTKPFESTVGQVLAVGGDPHLPVVDTAGVHPLLAAVHLAFSEHRPLALSPDAIWLTIAQGAAQHIRLHPDVLRDRVRAGRNKSALRVEWDGPAPATREEFQAATALFCAALSERADAGMVRWLRCDFSTSTAVERTASEIVTMDLFSPFFTFEFACICGIPEVTLLGTPDDYRSIAARVGYLDELGMQFWTRSLRPITEELVAASEGRPNVELWRELYKPRKAYGWARITGWIARLFPYLARNGRYDRPNPLLELSHADVVSAPAPTDRGWYEGPGITTADVPFGTSSVLVQLETHDGVPLGDVLLEGGLMCVEQDEEGNLAPRAGFVARSANGSVRALIHRLESIDGVSWREERLIAPADSYRHPAWTTLTQHADLNALYDAVERATLDLAAVEVRLRSVEEFEQVAFAIHDDDGEDEEAHEMLVAELSDGSGLLVGQGEQGPFVARADLSRISKRSPVASGTGMDPVTGLDRGDCIVRRPGLVSSQPISEVPIVGKTMVEVLSSLLDGRGLGGAGEQVLGDVAFPATVYVESVDEE